MSNAGQALAGPVTINGGTVQQNVVGAPNNMLNSQNVQISGGATLALANTAVATINALTFVNGGTVTTGTGTLTLNADLATIANSGSTSTAAISGVLSLGSTVAIFNVQSSGNTGTTPDLNVSAQIIGAAGDGMAKVNSGTVAFAGTANNTYNGQTTVDSGTLLFNMQTAAQAYSGTLVINGYGTVGDPVKVISNFSQLFASVGVVVNGAAGTLDISGSTAAQSISTLDLRTGTVLTGTNTLNIGGTVTGLPIGTKSGTISGKLALASTQIFAAADAGGQPGLLVQASIANGIGGAGGITKQGTGTVELANSVSNSYSAVTTVNEGTLLLNTSASANEVQNLVFSASSGTITGGTFTLTFNGTGSTATTANIAYTTAGTNFSGLVTNIQNALNALANVQPGNAVVALGSQNASGPTLTVTFVNQLGSQSILAMGRSSSLSGGTAPTLAIPTIATPGVAVLAVPGKLVIGNFLGGSAGVGAVGGKAQVVREMGNNEISATSAVTVNNSGWLDINGNVQTFNNSVGNALTLVGGAVTTEAGTLALSGTLAGQANAANQTAATISGNLSLGLASANTVLTVDVQPPALPLNSADLTISAAITGPASSNGSSPVTFGLTKVDSGTLQLTGTNTYTGPTTVSAGVLQVDGTQTASPVTVNAAGVVVNGVGAAVLSGTGTVGAVTATNGGTVNPGDPATGIGILTASSLNLTQTSGKGGILEIEITGTFANPGTAGVNYDQLNLGTGALTLDTTSAVTFDLNGLKQDVPPPGAPVVLYGTLPGTQAWSNVSAINNTFLSFTAAVVTLPQQTNVIISAPATHIVIQGTPANASAGIAFNFSVVAQDQFNNQAYGYLGTVHFATTDTNVNVSLPPNSVLTSGLGVFAATLITAGTQTITVTDTQSLSITGTTPIIVVPGPAAPLPARQSPDCRGGPPFDPYRDRSGPLQQYRYRLRRDAALHQHRPQSFAGG